MKYMLLLIVWMFSISEGIAQTSKIQVPDSVIVWSPDVKLAWTDFEGSSDEVLFGAAQTSYKIDIIPENVMVDENDNIQGYEKLTVDARFYKRQSWTATKQNSILVHERLHFDIAELFARKIRKRFQELKAGKQAKFSVYSKAYGLFWNACRTYQKEFDAKTDHGRVVEENKIWSNRIATELEELEAYK